MNKINQPNKNKILHNLGITIGIQVCLGLLAFALEYTIWSTVNSCYEALFAPGAVFLSIVILPIALYFFARKHLAYLDSLLKTLLCTLPVPMLILTVGFCFIFSKDWNIQAMYYLCNPMGHGFEYFLDFVCEHTLSSLPNSSVTALCLAQLTEATALTVGAQYGKAVSKQAEQMDKGE